MWGKIKNWFKNTWLGRLFSRPSKNENIKEVPPAVAKQTSHSHDQPQKKLTRKERKQQELERQERERQLQEQAREEQVRKQQEQERLERERKQQEQERLERERKQQEQQRLEREREQQEQARQEQERLAKLARERAEEQRRLEEQRAQQAREQRRRECYDNTKVMYHSTVTQLSEANASLKQSREQFEGEHKELDKISEALDGVQKSLLIAQGVYDSQSTQTCHPLERTDLLYITEGHFQCHIRTLELAGDEIKKQLKNLRELYDHKRYTYYHLAGQDYQSNFVKKRNKIEKMLKQSSEVLGIQADQQQAFVDEFNAIDEAMKPLHPRLQRYYQYSTPVLDETLPTLRGYVETLKHTKPLLDALELKLADVKKHYKEIKEYVSKTLKTIEQQRKKLQEIQNTLQHKPAFLDEEKEAALEQDELYRRAQALLTSLSGLEKKSLTEQFQFLGKPTQFIDDLDLQLLAYQERNQVYHRILDRLFNKLKIVGDLIKMLPFSADEKDYEETKKLLETYYAELKTLHDDKLSVESWMQKAEAASDTCDQKISELLSPPELRRLTIHLQVVKRVAQQLKADESHPHRDLLKELTEDDLIHFLNSVAIDNEWLFAEGLDADDLNIDLEPESGSDQESSNTGSTPPPLAPAFMYVYVYRKQCNEKKTTQSLLKDVFWKKLQREGVYCQNHKEVKEAKETFQAVLQQKGEPLTFKKLVQKIKAVIEEIRESVRAKEVKQETKKKVAYAYAARY